MKPDDRAKLLGGYAAGILTPAEREALLTAALEDQELFEALMREEPLRKALAQPDLRARLLDELKPENSIDTAPRRPLWSWWRKPLPIAGALAVLALAIGIRQSMRRTGTVHQIVLSRSQPAIRLEAPPEEKLTHDEAIPSASDKARASNPRAAQDRKDWSQSKPLTAGSASPRRMPPNGQAAGNDATGVPEARVQPAPMLPVAPKIEELPPQPAQRAGGAGGSMPQRQFEAMTGMFAGSAGGGRRKATPPQPKRNGLDAVQQDVLTPGSVQEQAMRSLAQRKAPLSAPLQISTLRETDSGNFAAASEFHIGDKVRFAVLADHAGSLTVSRQDAEGNWIVLYSSVPVSAARTVLLPESGALTLQRDIRFRFELTPPDAPAHAQELSLTVK